MKAYPVSQLESDSYFSKQAFLDENYILLSPETPVTNKLINRLKRWRYSQILSNGAIVDSPKVAESPSAEGTTMSIDLDIREKTLMEEAQAFYAELTGFVEKMFTNFVTRDELVERPVSDMIKRTIDTVRSHRRQILRIADLHGEGKNYIVNHSAKTAILAVSVGMVLRLPPFKLIELGTAALLHEIGMIRLPPNLYMSDNPLSDQEKRALTAHTVLGFKILRQFSFPMTVSLAVLECKENVDGSGYPRNLTGDKISTYAKVIMVTGSYAALTSARPFRPAIPGHNALMDMLKRKAQMYDETILRALIANLSIYPLGTYVALANGNRGIVVDNSLEKPREPKVRVIAGPTGDPFAEQYIVDTSSAEELRVAEAISPDAVGVAQPQTG